MDPRCKIWRKHPALGIKVWEADRALLLKIQRFIRNLHHFTKLILLYFDWVFPFFLFTDWEYMLESILFQKLIIKHHVWIGQRHQTYLLLLCLLGFHFIQQNFEKVLRTFLKKISFVYQAIMVELICDLGLEVPFWLKKLAALDH